MQLMQISHLPQIPALVHPLVGTGLVKSRLVLNHGFQSAEDAIARYRADHRAEKLPFHRAYFIRPHRQRGRVAVNYLLSQKPRRVQAVGATIDDEAAIRILIGNHAANCYLPIRYELYEDPDCNSIIDMGRMDQWDLLKGTTADQLRRLADKGIAPSGDWDFDRLIWGKRCSVCGGEVSVNDYAFDIDSVVCATCSNRPFLAPALHEMFDFMEELTAGDTTGQRQQMTLHALSWMAGVRANFSEVRLNQADSNGARACRLCWEGTMMARAINAQTAPQVRSLIEASSELGFDMYARCAQKVQRAMQGEESFTREHQIAMNFVLDVTRLLQTKAIESQCTK